MCRPLSEGGRRCPGKGGEYRRAQARRRYHERKVRDEFASRFAGGVPRGAAEQVVTNTPREVDLSRLPEHTESVFTASPDEVRRIRDEAREMIPAASSRARSAMNALSETRAVSTVSAGEEGDLRMKMSTAAKRYATAVDKHGEDSDKARRAWKSYERAESKVREALGQTDERIAAEREYVTAVSELGRVTETAILAAVAERGGGREEGLSAWADEMERMGLTPAGRELFVFPFSTDDEEDAHVDDVRTVLPAEAFPKDLRGPVSVGISRRESYVRAHMRTNTKTGSFDPPGGPEGDERFVAVPYLPGGTSIADMEKVIKRRQCISELEDRLNDPDSGDSWNEVERQRAELNGLWKKIEQVRPAPAPQTAPFLISDADAVTRYIESTPAETSLSRQSFADDKVTRDTMERFASVVGGGVKVVEFTDSRGEKRIALGHEYTYDRLHDITDGDVKYTVPGGSTHDIRLDEDDRLDVVVHEVSHLFEMYDSEMSAAAKRFVDDKARGKGYATYSENRSSPSVGREMTCPDADVFDSYITKVYDGSPSTEVVSSGMELYGAMLDGGAAYKGRETAERLERARRWAQDTDEFRRTGGEELLDEARREAECRQFALGAVLSRAFSNRDS